MHGADSLIFYDIPKVLALVIRRILRDLERDPEKVASAFLEVKFEKNLNELFSSDESTGGEEQQRQQQQHHERDPLDVLTDELKTKLNAADWTVLSPERDNDFPSYVIVKVFLDWLLHLGHPVLEVIWFLRPVALPAAAGATSSVDAADKKTLGRQSDASNYSTASSVDSSSPKLRELKGPNGESQTNEGAAAASPSGPMVLGHDKQGRALSSPSLMNMQDAATSSRQSANASAPVLRKSSMSELPTGNSAQNEGIETLKVMAKTGTVRAVAHLLRAIRAKCDAGKAFVVTSKMVMALVHERFNISENVVKTIESWLLNVREGHLRCLTEEYCFAAEVTFAKPEDQPVPFVETPLMEDESKEPGFDGSDDEGGEEEAPGGEMSKTEEGTEGSGGSNREEALLTVDVKPASGEPRVSGDSPKAAARDAFKLPVVNSRVPADIASGANSTAAPSPGSQVVAQASGVLPSPRSGRSPAKSSVKNRGPGMSPKRPLA